MSAELCVLIAGGYDKRAACAAMLPKYARARYCALDGIKIAEGLYDYSPDVIYLLFSKGEKPSLMSLEALYDYCGERGAHLAVNGSRAQLEAVRRDFAEHGGTGRPAKLTPANLASDILSVREQRLRERRSKALAGEAPKPLIVVISEDIRAFAYCDHMIPACEKGLDILYADPRAELEEREFSPCLVICCLKIGSDTQRIAGLIRAGGLLGDIPVILLNISGVSEYDPAFCGKLGREVFVAENSAKLRELIDRLSEKTIREKELV